MEFHGEAAVSCRRSQVSRNNSCLALSSATADLSEMDVFVDGWVLGHVVLSMAAFLLVPLVEDIAPLIAAVLGYGCLRIFEVIVYQVNVLLFDRS